MFGASLAHPRGAKEGSHEKSGMDGFASSTYSGGPIGNAGPGGSRRADSWSGYGPDRRARPERTSEGDAKRDGDEPFNAKQCERPLRSDGAAGRDSLLGPEYFDTDANVSRYFPIRENQRLELRFEFFDLGNNIQFNNPNNTLTSTSFGRIASSQGTRILQFALKYYF